MRADFFDNEAKVLELAMDARSEALCPFCGSVATLRRSVECCGHGNNTAVYAVRCALCNASGPPVEAYTIKEIEAAKQAVIGWNRRAIPIDRDGKIGAH